MKGMTKIMKQPSSFADRSMTNERAIKITNKQVNAGQDKQKHIKKLSTAPREKGHSTGKTHKNERPRSGSENNNGHQQPQTPQPWCQEIGKTKAAMPGNDKARYVGEDMQQESPTVQGKN